MLKRILFSLGGLATFVIITSALIYLKTNLSKTYFKEPLDKIAGKVAELGSLSKKTGPTDKFSKGKTLNILLLGIDRRHKSETVFRTDIMILLSINFEAKKVVLTSVPRDLWVGGGRINSVFVNGGWTPMQNAFETITGMKPEAYIQCDFEDLVWLIDALGGVEIEIDTSFTDNEYPNDITKTYVTVSFEKGKQVVDGKNALILSRSRHGNNGEGSDFKRMERQHKILKSLPEALLNPKSLFNPFTVEKFYEAITTRMKTNMTLEDSKYLYKYFPERSKYTIESFFIDSMYLYTPPMSEYGGAWVLVAKNNDYKNIHKTLKEKLGLIQPLPNITPTVSSKPSENQ